MSRTSAEVMAAVRSAGCSVGEASGGMSFRSGGTLCIAPPGIFNENGCPDALARTLRVRMELSEERAFDPTGYRGRGRQWQIYRAIPDPTGMVHIPDSVASMLAPGDRVKVGDLGWWGRPEMDRKEDIAALIDGIGGE